MRMAQLEAGIEDGKHFGATVQRPVEIAWAELTEEEKLGSIQRAVKYLSLGNDLTHLKIIDREVDLAAVVDWLRPSLHLSGEEEEVGPQASEQPLLSPADSELRKPAGDIIQQARQAAAERLECEGCEQAPEHRRDRER